MKTIGTLLIVSMLCGCSPTGDNPIFGWWGSWVLLDGGAKTNYLLFYFDETNAVFQGHMAIPVSYSVTSDQIVIYDTLSNKTTKARMISSTQVELYNDAGTPFIAYRFVPENFYNEGQLTTNPLLLGLLDLLTNLVSEGSAQPGH
ncbi:MAG TPA: hypothetical protein PLE77_13520 [Kiritimatiellia bacterium]|nr:hypothetical protein [Kiritimatiellia bacterium]